MMSSFLNQKIGQTFGQTVQSLGQNVNVELKVGSHTLLVKERVAEGNIFQKCTLIIAYFKFLILQVVLVSLTW